MDNHLKIDIVEDNELFVAINKPAGLLSIPDRMQTSKSLKEYLKDRYEVVYTVHRLDKDTSGLILFAKDEDTHKQLSKLFENREVEKKYVGFLYGKPCMPILTVEAPIAEHPAKNGTMMVSETGKYARTDFELLQDFGLYSWMSFTIYTGRTHQIRVHSKHLGHCIVCDPIYGDGKPVFVSSLKKNYRLSKKEEEEKPLLGRLGLHAKSLAFVLDGQKFVLEADLPKDMSALLKQLAKWNKFIKAF